MVTEDYVSFQTAKLLKEKGFDGKCKRFANIDTFKNGYDSTKIITSKNLLKDEILVPTLQMAMKWLRREHNIHIAIKSVIRTYGDTEYYYELYGIKNKSLYIVCDIYKGESWDSSEEATEVAIKYCLENLI